MAYFLDLNGFTNEDNKKAEKNWMTPYKENPNFDYVYGPTQIVKDRELITVRDINDEIKNLPLIPAGIDFKYPQYLLIKDEISLTKFKL